MDLKDFIKETLIQITEGVKEAQSECIKHEGLINPMLAMKICNNEKYRHAGEDYPATRVNFKIGLTESDMKGNKKGIGVFLSKITAGTEDTRGTETQFVTSIEFSVTAVLPYIDRTGKHVPVSSILRY